VSRMTSQLSAWATRPIATTGAPVGTDRRAALADSRACHIGWRAFRALQQPPSSKTSRASELTHGSGSFLAALAAADRGERREKVVGQLRFEPQPTSAAWMGKAEHARMESLVPETLTDRSQFPIGYRTAVERVAQDRRPALGQVHADLMRSARLESAAHVSRTAKAREGPHVRHGGLSLSRSSGKAQPLPGMSGMQRCNRALRSLADDDRFVRAVDGMRLKLRFQTLARFGRPRHDHHSTRALVEPVNDARAKVGSRVRRVGQVFTAKQAQGEKAVHQRARRVPERGVHDETRRFANYEDVRVGVHHVDADYGVRFRLGARRSIRPNNDPLSPLQARACAPRRPFHRDPAALNPALQLRSRHARGSSDESVQPRSVRIRRDDELDRGAGHAASPELRLDMPLGLDENIDERPVVEVTRVEIWRHAPLVEGAAFFDFLGERIEEIVVLNTANDLVLIVKGQIACNRPGETSRRFLGLNEGH
jgi:hypothetical protein